MSAHNPHIPTLLEVLRLLESVPGTELERKTLASKMQAYYRQNKDGLTGRALVDELTDDELVAAMVSREPALKLYCGPHIEPGMFNYIRKNRPGCIQRADRIRIGQ